MRHRLLSAVLSIVICLVVIAMLCRFMGRISGEEISPETFQRREFVYYELPLLRIQVYPISRVNSADVLAGWLASKGYLKRPEETSWDLISCRRNDVPILLPEAGILSTYLDTKTKDDVNFWQQWSEQNPALAGELWPRVSEVAQNGLYVAIPEMMDAATAAKSVRQLKGELQRILVEEYQQYASRQSALEDYESVVAALSEAIKLEPGNRSLRIARADAYEQMNQTTEAEADRRAAEKTGQPSADQGGSD